MYVELNIRSVGNCYSMHLFDLWKLVAEVALLGSTQVEGGASTDSV